MWVYERYLRYAIAALFAGIGIWAMLVRGGGWPFAMADLGLAEHRTRLAQQDLELALAQDDYDATEIAALGQEITAIEPLSPLPFEALLLLELERETIDAEAARALANAVMARDARNLTARLFLFDQAIIDQDWDRAFDAFGKVLTLWPSEVNASREIMYDSLADAAWTEALIARLDRDEAWVKLFIQDLPYDLLDTRTTTQLYRPFDDLHQRFVDRMGQEQGLEAAYKVWADLRPDEATSHPNGLIDPSFAGVDALRPFNWMIDPEYAEMNANGPGLRVFYRGRNEPVIASQILFLPPGEYRFAVQGSDIPDEPAGDLVWRLTCLSDEAQVFQVSVFDRAIAPVEGVAFEVHSDCPYQDLALMALPGVYTRRFGLTIEQIILTPRGS